MNQDINTVIRSIPVEFEVEDDIEIEDEKFLKVKIWMMHLGLNVNDCYFDKEVVEKALPTLSYVPIVGFIKETNYNEKDFDGHKYILTKKDGKYLKKYYGSAYGVIKSFDENNAHFENRMCDDGVEREFLVVEGLMWKQFTDSAEIMERDKIKGHSMELLDTANAVEGFEDEDGVFHFTKFSFRAACILGDDINPAMINSTIETDFTVSDFVSELQKEISTKMLIFSEYKNKQGGVTMPNNKTTEAQISTDFELSAKQLWQEVARIVREQETIHDDWGYCYSRYALADIQDNEVIVWDWADEDRLYGLSYTKNGDEIIIDWSSKKKKKIEYVDWQEGEVVSEPLIDLTQQVKDVEEFAQQKIEVLVNEKQELEKEHGDFQTKYTELEEKYNAIEPKYNDFVAAAQKAEAEALENKKLEIFSKYESALIADETTKVQFEEYKKNRDDMTPEDIEGKCAILYAQANLYSQKDSKQSSVTATVFSAKDDGNSQRNSRYGVIIKSK